MAFVKHVQRIGTHEPWIAEVRMRSVRSSPNNGFLEPCPHPPRRFVVPKIAQQESLERNTSRAFRLEVSATYSTGRLLGNAEAPCRQGLQTCSSDRRRVGQEWVQTFSMW